MPKVSIICGYYNRPALVRRTLEGIARQTFDDFEVLVFDDASTDDTAAVIRTVIADLGDPRFRLIEHVENMGFTRGLINAIGQSSAPYVAIHDSGDVSLPRRMAAQADLLDRRPDISVVGSHYTNFIESQGISRVRRPNADGATLESVLIDSTFTHGEVMFRRSTYDAAGGYRAAFRFSQDNDLWLRMIRLGRFATVPEMLYVRYIQFDGISYKPATFVQQSAYYLLGKMIARDPALEEKALARLAAGEKILDVIPVETPALQATITRGAMRAIVFGAFDQAREIAGYIVSPPRKALIRSLAAAAGTAPGRSALNVVRGRLGMSAGS